MGATVSVGPFPDVVPGAAGGDARFVIEGLGSSPGTRCWCGAELDRSPRAVQLVGVPESLRSLRGTSFHSAGCGIEYLTRTSRRMEAALTRHPQPGRLAAAERMREMLVKLMGELLAFDFTWV
ncbi:MAG: hypothetical protein ACRECR_03745 [Thermoplasmata archaeon]